MFETELAVKHTPQDGTRIHIACYLLTVQVFVRTPRVKIAFDYASVSVASPEAFPLA